MASNERIDIRINAETSQASRNIDQTSKSVDTLGRRSRGLSLPFIGGALLGGLFGASLLNIATSGAAASNTLIRLQSGFEQLFNQLFEALDPALIALEPLITGIGRFIDLLPDWVIQVGAAALELNF